MTNELLLDQPTLASFSVAGDHIDIHASGMSRRLYMEVLAAGNFGMEKLEWYLPDEPKFVMPPELADLPETDGLRAVFTTQALVAAQGYITLTAGLAQRFAGDGDVSETHVIDAQQVAVAVLPLSSSVMFHFQGSLPGCIADIQRILSNPPEDRELTVWAEFLAVALRENGLM